MIKSISKIFSNLYSSGNIYGHIPEEPRIRTHDEFLEYMSEVEKGKMFLFFEYNFKFKRIDFLLQWIVTQAINNKIEIRKLKNKESEKC